MALLWIQEKEYKAFQQQISMQCHLLVLVDRTGIKVRLLLQFEHCGCNTDISICFVRALQGPLAYRRIKIKIITILSQQQSHYQLSLHKTSTNQSTLLCTNYYVDSFE